MPHRPHLYLPDPWRGSSLAVSDTQRRHVEKVLRKQGIVEVTYTNGLGTVGQGDYSDGVVSRGPEAPVERPSELVVAVAAPRARDRQRFLVEKLQELGVDRIRWIEASRGEGRPPRMQKAQMWAVSALEQSRGAWLVEIDSSMSSWSELRKTLVVCDQSGEVRAPGNVGTLVIGPEGGWDSAEIPSDAVLWSLGPTVLRVETATIVAAARLKGDNGNG